MKMGRGGEGINRAFWCGLHLIYHGCVVSVVLFLCFFFSFSSCYFLAFTSLFLFDSTLTCFIIICSVCFPSATSGMQSR